MMISANHLESIFAPGLVRSVLCSLLDCVDSTSIHSFYLTRSVTLDGILMNHNNWNHLLDLKVCCCSS